jgi:hypothetical protein
MISGVVAPLRTLFDLWGLMMMMVEGKIEGPLCYDELSLRMLGFLGFELKALGELSRIWKAYQFREVYGAHLSRSELDFVVSF